MSANPKIQMPSDKEDAEIKAGINADPDAFEITDEMLRSTAFTVVDKRRGRGKQKQATKVQKTVRLKPEVLDYLKANERGWQQRLDKALEVIMREHPEGIEE